jgi:hypothetical protein
MWSIVKLKKRVGQKSRSRDRKLWYQQKGLAARKAHTKYGSLITYHSKYMAIVKVFADRQTNKTYKDRQTDGQMHRP